MRSLGFLLLGLTAAAVAVFCFGCGSDDSGSPSQPTNNITYQAVQYTITASDGRKAIIRSRGKGNGVDDAYFDIYIEDSTNTTIAFRDDPMWFHYAMPIEQAVNQTSETSGKMGDLPTAGSFYYLDIGGGSEQGGVSYHFHTAGVVRVTPTESREAAQSQACSPIYIHTEQGGVIQDTNGTVLNQNGAFFWNDTTWQINSTYAHLYFTDSSGTRLDTCTTDTLPAIGSGTFQIVWYSDTTRVVQSTYTYSVPKVSGGSTAKNLGSSFPRDFEVRVSGETNRIVAIHLTPKLLSEQK